MNCADTKVPETATEPRETVIQFPSGILGFEMAKRYRLLADPEEAPFAWLQMTEEPGLSFLVISPGFVTETYHPDIGPEVAELLGLSQLEDALVFSIVTLHQDGQATVNLKAPIVINRHTLVAKQVLPLNASAFSLQHPFPLRPT